MPSSSSFLDESGVWCADDESVDDFIVNGLRSPSASQVIRARAKHSGGSVDASGDVQIVDVKEVDSLKSRNKERQKNNRLRKSFGRKNPKSISSSSMRIPGISKKRRSSSFSKVFNHSRRPADGMTRRSSFGIKRMPKRRTFEVDDADVIWPDPGMFKSKNPEEDRFQEGRSTTKSNSTSITTCTARSYGMDSTLRRGSNIPGRRTRSERGSISRNTYSSSLTPRPSLASSVIRESQFYSGKQRPSHDGSVFFVEGKDCEYGRDTTLERNERTKGDPMEKMVESINLRNFMERGDQSRSKKPGLPWFVKQLSCLYLTTMFFIVVCFLLLGLTIWLIQDSQDLRFSIHELKTLIYQQNNPPRDAALDTYPDSNSSNLSH